MAKSELKALKPIKQRVFKAYLDFGGKRYVIHAIRDTEHAARTIAQGMADKGYLVRVVQYHPEVKKWAVYARR